MAAVVAVVVGTVVAVVAAVVAVVVGTVVTVVVAAVAVVVGTVVTVVVAAVAVVVGTVVTVVVAVVAVTFSAKAGEMITPRKTIVRQNTKKKCQFSYSYPPLVCLFLTVRKQHFRRGCCHRL